MIISLLGPISITGWGLIFYLPLNKKIKRQSSELSIWAAVSSLMVILYLAALTKYLYPIALALFWGGLLFWGIAFYFAWQQRIAIWTNFFSPGVIIFLSLSTLFILIFTQLTLQFWDEFSHWAIATKELVITHKLPGSNSSIIFKEYPLGINLIHYWVAVNIADNETNYYLGHFLLLVAPFITFFNNWLWRKNIWQIIFFLFGSILIICTLSVYLCSLMADIILTLYIGAGLFLTTYRYLSHKEIILFVPILMSFPLIKASGYIFAWAILILLLIIQCPNLLKKRHNQHWNTLITILTFLVILSAPLATQFSWNYRIKKLNIVPIFNTQYITLKNILNAFSDQAPKHQQLIRKKFVNAFWNCPLVIYTIENERSLIQITKKIFNLPNWIQPPKMPLIGWLILAGLLYIANFISQQTTLQRQHLAMLLGIFILFGIIYIFGLLLLYLFSFSEFEALQLASYPRYINTIIIPLLLIGLTFALHKKKNVPFRLNKIYYLSYWSCIIISFTGILVQAPSWNEILKWRAWGEASEERSYITPLTEQIKQLTNSTARIFIIYQGSSGRGFHIARYEITPRTTNQWFFSLGQPCYNGDVWTELITPKEWSKMLINEKFDYVFLQRTDEQFCNIYKKIFKELSHPRIHILYKVCKTKNKLVCLKPVKEKY